MANLSEILKFLSRRGEMREAERIRKRRPENLINLATSMQNLQEAVRKSNFERSVEESRRKSIEETAEQLGFATDISEVSATKTREELESAQETRHLRENFPDIVGNKEFSEFKGMDKAIKNAGLIPNPSIRSVAKLINDGRIDEAKRIAPNIYKKIVGGLPEAVRSAEKRGQLIGANIKERRELLRETFNLKVNLENLRSKNKITQSAFDAANKIQNFQFKLADPIVRLTAYANLVDNLEDMKENYGSDYKDIVEEMRKNLENAKEGAIPFERFEESLLNRSKQAFKMIEDFTGGSRVDVETGIKLQRNELSNNELRNLEVFSVGGYKYRRKEVGDKFYLYLFDSRMPLGQVPKEKWEKLSPGDKVMNIQKFLRKRR